jgi:hypothetical protein
VDPPARARGRGGSRPTRRAPPPAGGLCSSCCTSPMRGHPLETRSRMAAAWNSTAASYRASPPPPPGGPRPKASSSQLPGAPSAAPHGSWLDLDPHGSAGFCAPERDVGLRAVPLGASHASTAGIVSMTRSLGWSS